MDVIDLTDEYVKPFCVCLEDWSDEMREAGDLKQRWCEKMRQKGLRVKLARDDNGVVGGMIQYAPVEHSLVVGRGLYFIYCVWVHGHKSGRGDFQKRGMGKALLQAAEDDARQLGAKGMAAWGLLLPFWMKASWFKRQGYVHADRDGLRELVYKPFCDEARPPSWIKRDFRPPKVPGKVAVTAFVNGWCPVANLVYERAKRAAAEHGDQVELTTIDTTDRFALRSWGISDGVFVDGRSVQWGPPVPYEKIRRMLAKKVRKLPRRA